ncbi:MAG TPA: GNAT family N-acetyltransferase [Mycobacterium sp.]|jgi:GNAT superfamily N-acetyltransferase
MTALRPPQKADVRELAGVLARAFHDDPVMTWMLPDAGVRARGLPRMFATMTTHHFLAGGGAEVASRDGAIGGATLWDPPGRWRNTRAEEWRMKPAYLWALRSRVIAGQTVAELMKKHHPEEPHWYLMVIGTDPTVRGTGLGHALMRSRLDRCDAEHVPAYLENSNPKNEAYYMRFGFEVTGEITLPDGGPTLWPMWRNAR